MGWVRVENRLEISTQPNPLNKWVRRVDPFILNGLKFSTQPATIGLGSGWVGGLGHFLPPLFVGVSLVVTLTFVANLKTNEEW